MVTRLALLGAGRIGKVHAGAIASDPRARLVAVADAHAPSAEAIAKTAGDCEIRTIEEIEQSDDVDAVLICTPTNTHAELIERFARAGKAVFCEKPVDLSIERVRDCLKTIAETNATVMLGFNRRFDPHFQAVRGAIDEGRIGDVEMVTITSRDPGAPPPEYITVSGGMFRDMTIHDFDMARYLLGEEIDSVMASASVLVDPKIGELGDFDSASVILTTASGKQCVISNSRRASYGYDQRIEVHGSLGAVSAENQRPVSIEVATKTGYNRPALHDFFMTRYTQAYAAEIAAFIDALDNKTPASPSAQDGLMALALAEAALKSVHEKRAVKLSEITA
ncbi:myo-inositol 2-dehydrogenase/D-chiro-inositol 1-dehydrogenase [Paenochrobactrum gallinarii]|uniref:Myo-inositol 2-dehydrogenase/D-chiro-inositol 1-dehydrogenase n=1 Tax=Paenochrobactrum gallinarii TaxID=643673 RepID=A0A841LUQ8_9HYPH|nr:inositol 2-dehydrogenase [Paenochrobactrum gallinarii]MBB6262075.1 myo-inositol 2-dehydrogenase/D-chiro-inositol 1-dehydrogenase [Paenochrobactrum gallinarii]